MTLQQAADHLGVHYMTAYRYVKLGLLYAEKQRGSWTISTADLAAFEGEPAETDACNESLEDALIAGDEATAWKIVEEAIVRLGDELDVQLDVIAPALVSIGKRWAEGELSIADEHKASAVATRVVARLASRTASPGRRRGTVIVGAAPGDVHSIPSALFAELIRSYGVSVIDLGGSPDIDSFSEAVRRHKEAVVAISVTGPGHEAGARAAVEAVRTADADVPIAVGGGAIQSEDAARDLGASLWHGDSRIAAKQIAEAAASRRRDIG